MKMKLPRGIHLFYDEETNPPGYSWGALENYPSKDMAVSAVRRRLLDERRSARASIIKLLKKNSCNKAIKVIKSHYKK